MNRKYEAARAARAWDTIRAYAEAGGDTIDDRPLEYWFEELMTDLWHLSEERSFAYEFHVAIASGQLSTSPEGAEPDLTKQESMGQETHDCSIPRAAGASASELPSDSRDDQSRPGTASESASGVTEAEFVYARSFVVPVFVSNGLIRYGVYRYEARFESRDLHEVAREALRKAGPDARHADFVFGDLTVRAQEGIQGEDRCIRIGHPSEFDPGPEESGVD